jgi:hypothetical protein
MNGQGQGQSANEVIIRGWTFLFVNSLGFTQLFSKSSFENSTVAFALQQKKA